MGQPVYVSSATLGRRSPCRWGRRQLRRRRLRPPSRSGRHSTLERARVAIADLGPGQLVVAIFRYFHPTGIGSGARAIVGGLWYRCDRDWLGGREHRSIGGKGSAADDRSLQPRTNAATSQDQVGHARNRRPTPLRGARLRLRLWREVWRARRRLRAGPPLASASIG